MLRFKRVIALLCIVLTLGCEKPDAPTGSNQPIAQSPWFEDITLVSKLTFTHDPGSQGEFFMPDSIGSGAALFDFNNDGRLDIYLLQNAGPKSAKSNQLFRQDSDGQFKNVTEGSGLDFAGYGMGVAIGDVNNDGWVDVVVTEYGGVKLAINNGDDSFSEITLASGLNNPHWGVSASFLDYDRDGWLDLAIANYVDYTPTQECNDNSGRREFCGPSGFPSSVSTLFHNLGLKSMKDPASVHFEDVTVTSGLAQSPGPALGIVCADFNGDRWPDILFADDGAPNRLWINQKNGIFKEEATVRGLAYNNMGQTQADMGVALGDVDGNGYFDIFMTHLMTEYHGLWKQSPRGMFMDQTASVGLTQTDWRGTAFGAVMKDFDHNGALDVALVNGAIRRGKETSPQVALEPDSFWQPYAQRNQLLANHDRARFQDISAQNAPFCGTASVSRSLVCGDVDNDGDLDLLVTNIGDRARLFRNTAPKRGHWLMIRAIDPDLGGRDAYGAEISLQSGERRWHGWLNPAYSYLSSSDPRIHFGLGDLNVIDSIDVIWPDGVTETFSGCPANQLIVIRKGTGQINED